MLGFKYKKRQRKSIVHERTDLVACRESFMRRTQEIRKNEPDREIIYMDETWLNVGHRIKKEWVDLEALQNPCRSIADYHGGLRSMPNPPTIFTIKSVAKLPYNPRI